MKEATKRSIFRWIHLVFSIPILGYIYSPFDKTSNLRSRNSVCLRPCNGPFGIVDVERPCRSTTDFEKIDLTAGGAPLSRFFEKRPSTVDTRIGCSFR